MCLYFHICPICVIISLSTVLFGFWQRDRYSERESKRERRLKYIELFKGLPAVHHCHLTHVECEVPSQQPLGGHLLQRTHKHGYTRTHTCMWHPKFLHSKKKRIHLFIVAESDDNGTHIPMYMHTQCWHHLPSLPKSPETVILRFGLVSTCQNEQACLFFSFFVIVFLHPCNWAGFIKRTLPQPFSITLTLTALIKDLTWQPVNYQRSQKQALHIPEFLNCFHHDVLKSEA